jgi:predicted phosphodiesterase
MKIINSGRVLLLSDLHQDVFYAEKALENNFDHVVFMGDYFDTLKKIDNEKIYGMEAMCKWLSDKYIELGDRATWLIGNHDVSYLAGRKLRDQTHRLKNFVCSGYTNKKRCKYSKYINLDWEQSLQLAVQVGKYTISHAGFSPTYMPHINNDNPIEEGIKNMCNEWNKVRSNFMLGESHWIAMAGYCRGGGSPVGGPTWLDWNHEFTEIQDINQIVGHTTTPSTEIRIKQSGNSINYCIDNLQQTYAILENDKIEIINIENHPF